MSSTGFDISRRPISPGGKPVTVRIAKPAIATKQTPPKTPVFVTTPIQTVAPVQQQASAPAVSRTIGSLKTTMIAIAAAIGAFGFSIATGQVMARVNNSPQSNTETPSTASVSSAPLADASIRTNPASPSGLAVTEDPNTLAFSPVVITDPNAIYLPEEKMDVPDPLTQRKAFLKTYLESKHSVLASHVDALSEQTQWKLIIAISNSESSYCKHNMVNNCWGIGGAWNLKAYDNYDQAIADVNRLLEQKYVAAGLDSPDKIEQKWVGHPNDNWETAANQVMDDLKDVQ